MTQTINDGQVHTINSVQNQNYILQNGTIDLITGGQINGQYNNPFNPIAIVIKGSNQLNCSGGNLLGPGGSIAGGTSLIGGMLNISAGTITGGQGDTVGGNACINTKIVMNGGEITGGQAGNTGGVACLDCVVTLNEGQITGGPGNTMRGNALQGGKLTMTNGNITGSLAQVNTTLSGGTIGNTQGGSLNLSGEGSVGNCVDTSLTMTSGSVRGSISFRGTHGTISGGSIGGQLEASGWGSVTITGGTMTTTGQSLYLWQGTSAHISGGNFRGFWQLIQGSNAYVSGSNLVLNGNHLTGTLEDGSTIDVKVSLIQGSQIHITNN